MNVGLPELVLIAVVALLVVGPERLPGLARQAAELAARFRGEARKSIDELRAAADFDEVADEVSALRRELQMTRDEVTGALKGERPRDDKPVSPGGPSSRTSVGTSAGADDEDPPMDPEAT